MSTPLFIWLGSGRARRRGVGSPARQLDQAAHAGLPVPPGAVLLDEFFRFALDTGLARADGRGVVIPDAELWHNTLFHSVRLPRFRRPVAVYAVADATTAADAPAAACRDIDFAIPSAAARAIETVWSVEAASSRRDTLVIESVAATTAGVATTDSATDADWLAPSGAAPFALPHLRHQFSPDAAQPPFARRLQQLLGGVRRTFGPGVWRVEWADDGHICWLIQVIAVPSLAVQTAPNVPGAKA
jgi:hypothetical protein